MDEGNRQVQLVARGATIGRAVDVAEICRRRNGIIAQGLPAEVDYWKNTLHFGNAHSR